MKKNKKKAVTAKQGVMLVAMLAILILVINIVTASYSWFTPQTKTGSSINYSANNALRSEDCSMKTYLGTMQSSGKVTYATDPGDELNTSQTINSSGVIYFRTVVDNAASFATDVSLFIESIPVGATVAVTVPSNTVKVIETGKNTDFAIIRNAYISVVDAMVAGSGELKVDWFVQASSGTEVDIPGLYLTYN